MADALLTPPPEWSHEAQALPIEELVLTYYPRKDYRLPGGRTWDDVEQDLEHGTWLMRDRQSRYEAFRLGGREFEMKVSRKTAREAEQRGRTVWLTTVDWVESARSVPPKAHWLRPRQVRVVRISDEVECDIAELETRIVQRERQMSKKAWRSRGADRIGSHGDLQRAVRREYGELETLIDLLAERPAEAEAEMTGVVAASSRQGMIRVNGSGDVSLEPFQRQRVQVETSDRRAFHTRVVYVRHGYLEIDEPRNWQVSPGREVAVRVVPPFGMRQNADALKHFWAGNIEGSWDDLARLLCRPERLSPLPRLRQELKFYCDDDPDPKAHKLNDEQRKAVSGAVLSPHAFLIQGPPGTGKTEVISEIIRQLTGRGERVLLLAPSHVAVDEALSRVGHKPGLRPLRITFSDDKVHESQRVFLPENAGIEAARKVLRSVDATQLGRWSREHAQVAEGIQAHEDLAAVEDRIEQAKDRLRSAHEELAHRSEQLQTLRASVEADIADLEREAIAAEQERAEREMSADATMRAEQLTRERVEPLLRGIRDALVIMVACGEKLIRAEQDESRAVKEQADWEAADYASRVRAAADARSKSKALYEGAAEEARKARSVFQRAQDRFADVAPPNTAMRRIASWFRLSPYARLRHELAIAETEARMAAAALSERETALRAATAAYEELSRWVASERVRIENAVREHTAARVAATQPFNDALETFQQAYFAAAPGLRKTVAVASVSQWLRLASVANARICAALPPGPGHPYIEPAGDWASATPWELEWDSSLYPLLDELSAAADSTRWENEQRNAARQRHREWDELLRQGMIHADNQLREAEESVRVAETTLTIRRTELDHLVRERAGLTDRVRVHPSKDALERRDHVLSHLPELAARWNELASERTGQQVVEDIQQSIIRATNLVCATTKGIVGGGSQLVRHADYDTLIVDEASRVTESEFLIGAVRARRWVLVGDEHQLSPYVETWDEHFLHALTALHRYDSGRSASLENAVKEIGRLWQEDEDLRKFRDEPVLERAASLADSGSWGQNFAGRFAEAYERFITYKKPEGDPDRALLGAMIRYLIQSLFERVVTRVDDSLRQPLIWQRRMIAPLAEVVNKPVYKGDYRTPSEEELADAGVTPLITSAFNAPCVFMDTSRYRDADDTQENYGFYNAREIDLVTKICGIYNTELKKRREAEPVTTSVLTFYSAQARRMRNALLPRNDLTMLDWQVIDVIDRIQGQQSDLVIVSFTRAKRKGFSPNYAQWLMDIRRLNVACTRARRALVLVGHGSTLRRLGGREPQDAQARKAKEFYDNLFTLLDSGGPFLHRFNL